MSGDARHASNRAHGLPGMVAINWIIQEEEEEEGEVKHEIVEGKVYKSATTDEKRRAATGGREVYVAELELCYVTSVLYTGWTFNTARIDG